MSDKIATANEVFLQYNSHGFDCKCGCQDGGSRTRAAMIQFAKLHVEAALKAAIEAAPSGSSTDTVSYEDVVKALSDCYPLNLIQ